MCAKLHSHLTLDKCQLDYLGPLNFWAIAQYLLPATNLGLAFDGISVLTNQNSASYCEVVTQFMSSSSFFHVAVFTPSALQANSQQKRLVTTSSGRWIVDASLNGFNTAIPVESLGRQTSRITIRRKKIDAKKKWTVVTACSLLLTLSFLTDRQSFFLFLSFNISVTKINIFLHMVNIIWSYDLLRLCSLLINIILEIRMWIWSED